MIMIWWLLDSFKTSWVKHHGFVPREQIFVLKKAMWIDYGKNLLNINQPKQGFEWMYIPQNFRAKTLSNQSGETILEILEKKIMTNKLFMFESAKNHCFQFYLVIQFLMFNLFDSHFLKCINPAFFWMISFHPNFTKVQHVQHTQKNMRGAMQLWPWENPPRYSHDIGTANSQHQTEELVMWDLKAKTILISNSCLLRMLDNFCVSFSFQFQSRKKPTKQK